MKRIIKTSRLAALFVVTMFLPGKTMAQSTFNFGYQTVFASQANEYLVSAVNAERYQESFTPESYWGPSENDVLATLTYEFNFGAPSAQISLTAALTTFNFVWGDANGYYGSGTGSASLWASTDGSSWQLLANLPTPSDAVSAGVNYNQDLPSSLLGSSSLWLQVDMEVDGAPNSSYTTAQFGRSDTSNPNNIFAISVTTVPEPSTAWLAIFGGLGVCFLRCRKSAFLSPRSGIN